MIPLVAGIALSIEGASTPKIGVAVSNITAIVSQLNAGFIIDQFGLFGADMIPFSWSKSVGLLFVVVALLLIFEDEHLNKKEQHLTLEVVIK